MTMPHSKPVRRNKLNKIRKKQGLPPLPVGTNDPVHVAQRGPGVSTLLVPMPTPIRAMLTKIRRETQRRDPSTSASDQLFAGAILTAMLPQMEAQLFPSLIQPPTAANMAQAQKVDKVLARSFVG